MDREPENTAIAETTRLGELALAFDEANKPSALEIREALELGFARLMSLEAGLQRAGGRDQGLKRQIAVLLGALTRLRELTATGAASWRTLGFVLPERAQRSRR